jgi:hypothetical protein
MCDYSLEAYQSRPATTGEKLNLDRFPSGSMGFSAGPASDVAVCVLPDAQLRLEGLSETVQKAYGVGPVEEVVMTRLEAGPYKDAVRFSNGAEVVLQRLDRGLTVVILATAAIRAATHELIDPTAIDIETPVSEHV